MTIEYDQAFVDVLDKNNAGRYDVRREWRRRLEAKGLELAEQVARGRRASAEGARPRSLPSGPAPSWAGFALSLALLGISAVGLSAAVVGFVAVNAVQNAWSAATRRDQRD